MEVSSLSGLKRKDFQSTIQGKQTDLFTLVNKHGHEVSITNYGGARAIITEAERDELLDEFVSFYLESLQNEHNNKG